MRLCRFYVQVFSVVQEGIWQVGPSIKIADFLIPNFPCKRMVMEVAELEVQVTTVEDLVEEMDGEEGEEKTRITMMTKKPTKALVTTATADL